MDEFKTENRGTTVAFDAAVKANKFTEDAVGEMFSTSMDLAKEIMDRPKESHTEIETKFLVAQAKLAVAMMMKKFASEKA